MSVNGAARDLYVDWGLGVITALLPDQIPANASPAARNSALYFVGSGGGVPGTRPSVVVMNRTAITGSPQISGMYAYKTSDGTIRHLLVGSNGRIERLNTDTTLSNISTAWTSSASAFPDFATAKDLCFIVDGTNQTKLRNLTVEALGIVRLAAPGVSAGGAGSMTGDYQVAVTAVNANTTHESSRSDFASITLAANSLTVTWDSTPSDTQITHIRTYIRKPTLGIEFYQVAETAVAAGTVTVDVSDVAYQFLLLVGPDTAENDPPPAGMRFVAWHRNRLFLADAENLYYSKLDKPEAFDPEAVEPINPFDGQDITGIVAASEGVLLILKRDSTWALIGDDPSNWSLELIDPGVGGTSHRSIWKGEKIVGWWTEQGPVVFDGAVITNIGQPTMRPTFGPTGINPTYVGTIASAIDIVNQKVITLSPGLGGSRLNQWHPFNYRLGVWESELWDPIDAASIAVVEDALGQPQLYVGGYAGQVFKIGGVAADGVAEGTTTGTFVPAASSITTITASGFDTTGAGLIERYVYVEDANGLFVGRRRIASNSATVLTLDSALTGLTIGATYTFTVGATQFYWDTKISDFGTFYTKKRFYFLYGQATSNVAAPNLKAELTFDYGVTPSTSAFTFATNVIGAIFDVSEFDEAVFGTENIASSRSRIGKVAQAYKVRVKHLGVGVQVILRKLEVRADEWRDRR